MTYREDIEAGEVWPELQDAADEMRDENRRTRGIVCARCGESSGAFLKQSEEWVCLEHLPKLGQRRKWRDAR